jgi:hypothetical protein
MLYLGESDLDLELVEYVRFTQFVSLECREIIAATNAYDSANYYPSSEVISVAVPKLFSDTDTNAGSFASLFFFFSRSSLSLYFLFIE